MGERRSDRANRSKDPKLSSETGTLESLESNQALVNLPCSMGRSPINRNKSEIFTTSEAEWPSAAAGAVQVPPSRQLGVPWVRLPLGMHPVSTSPRRGDGKLAEISDI